MKRFIRSLFGTETNHAKRTPHPRRPSTLRPQIEALEDRLALTTFKVTTFADVVNPNDGLVSLREAITMANASAAPDAIKLKAGEYKMALGDLGVTNAVTFKGKGATGTFIDGGGQYRLFDIHGTDDITLSKLTLRNEAPEPLNPAGNPIVYLDMGSTGDGPNTDSDCQSYADLVNEIDQEIESIGAVNDTDLLLAVVREDVIDEAMNGGCFVVYMASPPRPISDGTLVPPSRGQTATGQRAPLAGVTDPRLVGQVSDTVMRISASSPNGPGTNHDELCKNLGMLADGWYWHAENDRRTGDNASAAAYTDAWTSVLDVAEKLGCNIDYAV